MLLNNGDVNMSKTVRPLVYSYDGKELKKSEGFSEKEKGIYGFFSVFKHPTESQDDVVIFYSGENESFRHPFLYHKEPNLGFLCALGEYFYHHKDPRRGVSGGKSGHYAFFNGKLFLAPDCFGNYMNFDQTIDCAKELGTHLHSLDLTLNVKSFAVVEKKKLEELV